MTCFDSQYIVNNEMFDTRQNLLKGDQLIYAPSGIKHFLR
jgi:hypothetical protein